MLKRIVLAVAVLVAGAALCSASPLFINNSSFEFDALGSGGFTINTIAGWTVASTPGQNQGVMRPTTTQYSPLSCCVTGSNVAYAAGGTISQVLAATLSADTTYTLSVDVLNRLDGPATLDSYSIALFAGITQLNLLSNPVIPGKGAKLTATLSFVSPDVVAPGQALEIRLISATQVQGQTVQVNFDNVSLDAVPEPASALLLLMGIGGLALVRRRRSIR